MSSENNNETCTHFGHVHPEEAVKIVEEWSKEHPRKTNWDKLKEIFPNDEFETVFNIQNNEKIGIVFDWKWLAKEYNDELLDKS